MTDFTLLDLYSQRADVMKFVEGMSEQEILDWMGTYGTVTKITTPYESKSFSFRSKNGIITAFRFDENGMLIIFPN